MHLKNIQLQNFKNYGKVQLEFSAEINCFLGVNGSGKTNLLDAIHYLCLTKSAFNAMDSQSIRHQQQFFTIRGDFELPGKSINITCVLENGKKKTVKNSGKAYEKMSGHIGLLPIVLIAPDDASLIKEGSEERRKFFDSMLSQINRDYLDKLVRYQHFLKQRNALIRKFAELGKYDQSQLEPYDFELIQLSRDIFQTRLGFIQRFRPILLEHYAEISGKKETIDIQYESDCMEAGFESTFKDALQKDLMLKRTTRGIHKDEFLFNIDGYPIKKFGSQGQIKSFLIALKLAQFQVFHEAKETKPLLLLDDIFDKLDDARISKMMELVANHQFGQLFITDARPERSKTILKNIHSEVFYFEITGGKCMKEG